MDQKYPLHGEDERTIHRAAYTQVYEGKSSVSDDALARSKSRVPDHRITQIEKAARLGAEALLAKG